MVHKDENGAPPYIARFVNQLLRLHFFDDRIISRKLSTVWFSISLNLFFATFGCGDIFTPCTEKKILILLPRISIVALEKIVPCHLYKF